MPVNQGTAIACADAADSAERLVLYDVKIFLEWVTATARLRGLGHGRLAKAAAPYAGESSSVASRLNTLARQGNESQGLNGHR
jgi:hypothetical protein